MTITVGDKMPDAGLLTMTDEGPNVVELGPLLKGRKVVVFGLPGAFTGTCHTAHMPSFIRTADAFHAKGVEQIICIAVNDPFVTKTWAEASGTSDGPVTILADSDGALTKAIGMDFDAPPVGFYGRSTRYSMLLEDGVVKILNTEDKAGVCELTAGENLLDQI